MTAKLPSLAEAARAVLGDHDCARCHWPTRLLMDHPEYHPECVLRRVLDERLPPATQPLTEQEPEA